MQDIRKFTISTRKRTNFAIAKNITLLSTVELLKGFIKLKKREITFGQFNKILTTNGIVKF